MKNQIKEYVSNWGIDCEVEKSIGDTYKITLNCSGYEFSRLFVTYDFGKHFSEFSKSLGFGYCITHSDNNEVKEYFCNNGNGQDSVIGIPIIMLLLFSFYRLWLFLLKLSVCFKNNIVYHVRRFKRKNMSGQKTEFKHLEDCKEKIKEILKLYDFTIYKNEYSEDSEIILRSLKTGEYITFGDL